MARILAVDDDADTLLLTEASLRQAGHEVATCRNPAEVGALTSATTFDALILDINMPEISGLDVLRGLREVSRTRSLPVLLLSSRGGSSDRVRGLREGADDYLVKPFDPDELLLRIERLVATRSARGALAGDLETYPVWDLLQSLDRSGRSGTVLIVSGERSAELYLMGGRVIEAHLGGLSGEEAMTAALDFVSGSFRFFEGDLLGSVQDTTWIGMDAASVVLRHVWLLEAARQGEAAPPGRDEPFLYRVGAPLDLPSRLDSPAVHALLAELAAHPRTTRATLEALELAAPLSIEALLAHLVARGAVQPDPEPAAAVCDDDLTPRLHEVLEQLYTAGRERRRSMQNLHLLLLASPAQWQGLLDLLRQLPAGTSPFHPGDLGGIETRLGGSWLLHHGRGEVSLHLQCMGPGAQRQALQVLPLCAGVVFWADGSDAVANAAPLLGAVERSGWGQRGALFLPAAALAALPEELRRWRAAAAPPADLAVALSPLLPV